jgi:hypothetical protein
MVMFGGHLRADRAEGAQLNNRSCSSEHLRSNPQKCSLSAGFGAEGAHDSRPSAAGALDLLALAKAGCGQDTPGEAAVSGAHRFVKVTGARRRTSCGVRPARGRPARDASVDGSAMRVKRVDAAVAIRPYMILALKREFLSSGFDQQPPSTSSATNLARKKQLMQTFGGGSRIGTEMAANRDRPESLGAGGSGRAAFQMHFQNGQLCRQCL